MHQTYGVLLCSNENGQVGYCALETEASNFESYFAVDIACVAGVFFWGGGVLLWFESKELERREC